MRCAFLIILSFTLTLCQAQRPQKEYLGHNKQVVAKKRDAKYYRKISYDAKGDPDGLVRWYDLRGNLLMDGYLSSGLKRTDTFRNYTASGNIGKIRVYENGNLTFEECYTEHGLPLNFCTKQRDSLTFALMLTLPKYSDLLTMLMLGGQMPKDVDIEEALTAFLFIEDQGTIMVPSLSFGVQPIISDLFFKNGYFKRGVKYLQKIDRALGIKSKEKERCLIKLVQVLYYLRLGMIEPCEEALNYVKEYLKRTPEETLSIGVVVLEAQIAQFKGHYQAAEKTLKPFFQAVSTSTNKKDDNFKLQLANELGKTYQMTLQMDSAEKYFRIAIQNLRKKKAPFQLASLNSSLGFTLFYLGRSQEAIPLLKEAFALADNNSIGSLSSTIANNLGMIYLEIGNLDSCHYWVGMAADVLDSTALSHDLQHQSNLAGISWLLNSRTERSLEEIRKVRLQAEQVGSNYIAADILNKEGYANIEMGNYEMADSLFQMAIGRIDRLDLPYLKSTILNNQGANFLRRGYQEKALLSFMESLQLSRDKTVSTAYIQCLQALTSIQTDRGDLIQAKYYALLADSLTEAHHLLGLNAEVKSNLGTIYSIAGQIDSAKFYLRKSINLSESIGQTKSLAHAETNLGQAFIREGNLDSAWAYSSDGYQHFRDMNSELYQAIGQVYLGQIARAQGKTEQAYELYQSGEKYFRENELLHHLAPVLTLMAICQLDENNLEAADSILKQSMDLTEQSIRIHTGEVSRLWHIQQNSKTYPIAIEVASRKEDIVNVFNFAERQRTRVLNDIIGKRIDQLNGIPRKLLNTYDSLKVAYQNLDRQLQRTPSKTRAYHEYLSTKKECFLGIKALESEIREKYPTIYRNTSPFDLAKVQKSIPIDETWISIIQGLSWMAVVVTNEDMKLLKLGSREELDSLFLGYRSHFLSPMERFLEKGDLRSKRYADRAFPIYSSKLYEKVWNPIFETGLVHDKDLVIAADGLSNVFPFGILQPSPSPKPYEQYDYLVKSFDIRYTPSFSIKQKVEAKSSPFQTAFKGFFPEEFGQAQNQSFASLPNGKNLAQAVTRAFKGQKVDHFYRLDCTESKIKDHDLSDTRILHFHSHTYSSGRDQLYIVLPEEEGITNRLDLVEIMDLKINADLVVLGSCGSGIGDYQTGEGNMGFARGFFGAGAKALITSVSSIEEAATVSFFTRYYNAIADSPQQNSKATLLNQVQRDMISHPTTANPYYWGSFVYLGRP